MSFFRHLSRAALVACLWTLPAAAGSPWSPLPATAAANDTARARATESRLHRLDFAALRAQLATAPREQRTTTAAPAIILLPAPDGTLQRFAVEESAILHPDLQAKFPHLRTYAARGLDDASAIAQLDDTDHGFHAQVLSGKVGRWLVDPLPAAGPEVYQSFYRRDAVATKEGWTCHLSPLSERAMFRDLRTRELPQPEAAPTGATRRTFRVAIAATGEYTSLAGGTISGALSAITTTLNRVAGIYQAELSISFQLVANNNLVIYTNASTDPFPANDLNAAIDANQALLDGVIGSDNYDLGHVFTNRGGGLAQLQAVCREGFKGTGGAGISNPLGTAFAQEYVAHEFGHMFGARHTFNGSRGSCTDNRDSVAAFEPGSGTTIMSYAGICDSDDLLTANDPYFHAHSLHEMTGYLTTVPCGQVVQTGNRPPVITVRDYVIPNGTAFTLPASGYDPDGDPIQWTFEQADLGPQAPLPNFDTGVGPQYRSRPPSLVPFRSFPKHPAAQVNQQDPAEPLLQATNLPGDRRVVRFRITARDGRGGVTTAACKVTLLTYTSSGVRIVEPLGQGPFAAGTPLTVRWDVNRSDSGEVATAAVNIRLSTDGGQTFPYLLASAVPNNGSTVVTLPSVATTQGRLKLEAVGNIFCAYTVLFFSVTTASPTIPPPPITPTPTPTPPPSVTPTPTPTPIGGPTPTPTPTPTPIAAPRLVNVSTRLRVESGDAVAIAGFVISGNAPTRVLIRALGPSLAAFGVGSPLANPSLELVGSAGPLATNDDWRTSQQADIQQSGFAPTNDLDSAIVATVPPGSYTAILRGVGGSTGVGIVEVYQLDRTNTGAKVINLSTRGQVLTGENVMIGGFVVEGPQPRKVLIRALGPSLAAFGVTGTNPDPVITLKNAAGTTLAENDDWDNPEGQPFEILGLAPIRRTEAALLMTLQPGAYTVLVSGYEDATGVALFEVYEIP